MIKKSRKFKRYNRIVVPELNFLDSVLFIVSDLEKCVFVILNSANHLTLNFFVLMTKQLYIET